LDGEEERHKKTIYVHRAVADHFLEAPREDQKYIIHKDGDHSNNRDTNLKWATKKELAELHYETRVKSTRSTWVTRRKLYGESGLKEKKDDKNN